MVGRFSTRVQPVGAASTSLHAFERAERGGSGHNSGARFPRKPERAAACRPSRARSSPVAFATRGGNRARSERLLITADRQYTAGSNAGWTRHVWCTTAQWPRTFFNYEALFLINPRGFPFIVMLQWSENASSTLRVSAELICHNCLSYVYRRIGPRSLRTSLGVAGTCSKEFAGAVKASHGNSQCGKHEARFRLG